MTDAKAPSALTRAVLLAVLSFAGGVLNGLLGTGGGMILLFALGQLLSAGHGKDAFGCRSGISADLKAVCREASNQNLKNEENNEIYP